MLSKDVFHFVVNVENLAENIIKVGILNQIPGQNETYQSANGEKSVDSQNHSKCVKKF